MVHGLRPGRPGVGSQPPRSERRGRRAVFGICFGSDLTAQFTRVQFLVAGCEQGAACNKSFLGPLGSDAYHLRAPR
jgi:hypothetical protein